MSRESGKTATNGKVGGIPAKPAITNSDYFSQLQLSKIRTSVTLEGIIAEISRLPTPTSQENRQRSD